MKKKLIRVANQIYVLEDKIQKGENLVENMERMEDIIASLSSEELWEVNKYLEEKMNVHPL